MYNPNYNPGLYNQNAQIPQQPVTSFNRAFTDYNPYGFPPTQQQPQYQPVMQQQMNPGGNQPYGTPPSYQTGHNRYQQEQLVNQLPVVDGGFLDYKRYALEYMIQPAQKSFMVFLGYDDYQRPVFYNVSYPMPGIEETFWSRRNQRQLPAQIQVVQQPQPRYPQQPSPVYSQYNQPHPGGVPNNIAFGRREPYPNQQPVFGMNQVNQGQKNEFTQYRSKVNAPIETTNPNPGYNPYSREATQPHMPVQPQQVPTQPVQKVEDEVTLKRLAELEKENIKLKENVKMLEVLYKDLAYKVMISEEQLNKVKMEENVSPEGVKTYTLLGDKVKEIPTYQTKIHQITNNKNQAVAFINPVDAGKEPEDFKSLNAIADQINEDFLSQEMIDDDKNTIYRHLLRIGENKAIRVEDRVLEELKKAVELNPEPRNEEEDEENTEEGYDVKKKYGELIANDISAFKVAMEESAMDLVSLVDFLIKSKQDLHNPEKNRYKYLPEEYIDYVMESLKDTYNDFVRVTMDLRQNAISELTIQEVSNAHNALRGLMQSKFKRDQEQINNYTQGLKVLLNEFFEGYMPAKIRFKENDQEERTDVFLYTNKGYRVYSWDVMDDISELDRLMAYNENFGIIVPEANSKLYGVIESILSSQHDILQNIQEIDVPYEKVIHNAILRVGSHTNSKSVAFRIYKTFVCGGKYHFVLQKVYQSF